MTEVRLSAAQRAAVDGGGFVRVELGSDGVAIEVVPGVPVRVTSALVGRARGRLRAFLNVCRHQAVPLDVVLGVDADAARGDAVPAPLSDAGDALLCLRHGASYRLEDGACTAGPCVGARLHGLEALDAVDGPRVRLRLVTG